MLSLSNYMKKIKFLLVLIPVLALCQKNIDDQLEKLPDSIKVNDIVIKNLFKYQVLAHKNDAYNSEMITNKVYLSHKKLWDSCYGTIFGDENAVLFNNPEGMTKWNKTFYPENKVFIDSRVQSLLKLNLQALFSSSLKKFNKLVPYKPKARISILFTPITGIAFGGCNAEQFALELNNKSFDPAYLVEKGLAHELNHLVYEKYRDADPDKETALAQTVEEGFACYFSWVFFNGKMQKYEAVENMSPKEWQWYLENEKQIFEKVKPYFNDTSGKNALLRNDKVKLFPDAPKTLNYWLGFRIIEKYVQKHGSNSWKDIYGMTSKQVLEKSGYEDYINSL